ncbi:pyridoxal phosphate-dependent transferase, partial [Tanacetum coccineum]
MIVASKKPLLENLMIMLMISYSSILKVMTTEHNDDALLFCGSGNYSLYNAASKVTGGIHSIKLMRERIRRMKSYPYVDIDMRSAVVGGYDAITLSPHKFLGRPRSPGILLMNKALYQLKNSLPSTCGTVNYVDYYDEK